MTHRTHPYWHLAAITWGLASGIGFGACLLAASLYAVLVACAVVFVVAGFLIVLAWKEDRHGN